MSVSFSEDFDVAATLPRLPERDVATKGSSSAITESDAPSKISPATAFYLGRRQTLRDIVSSIPLLFVDIASVLMSLSITSVIAILLSGSTSLTHPVFVLVAIVMTVVCHHVHGLYPACGLTYSLEYRRILRTCLLVLMALASGLLLQRDFSRFPFWEFFIFAGIFTLALTSSRSLARHVLGAFDWWVQPVVLLGDSQETNALYHRLNSCRNEGLRAIGILYDPRSHWDQQHDQVNQVYIGPESQMEEILLRTGTCRLAVAGIQPLQQFDWSRLQGIPHVMTSSDLGHHPTEKVRLVDRDGRLELHTHSTITSPGALAAKRLMDLALIIASAPFWIPLVVLIGISIKICDPGPIFYRQSRVGRFRKPFQAIKFRSMVCNADQKLNAYLDAHPELQAEWQLTHKLKNDPRVTQIGEFLRKTSLDELPQLWNVLMGEMSLVGPRPIIDCSDYDREYIEDHPEVFELYKMVRPGITGLWQVSGRNATSYSARVYFDRFYLNNWSLMLDVFILWRTIKTALFREGAC
jgi:Undecaprenyl-phosphate galactose phosphotransferase WbaP